MRPEQIYTLHSTLPSDEAYQALKTFTECGRTGQTFNTLCSLFSDLRYEPQSKPPSSSNMKFLIDSIEKISPTNLHELLLDRSYSTENTSSSTFCTIIATFSAIIEDGSPSEDASLVIKHMVDKLSSNDLCNLLISDVKFPNRQTIPTIFSVMTNVMDIIEEEENPDAYFCVIKHIMSKVDHSSLYEQLHSKNLDDAIKRTSSNILAFFLNKIRSSQDHYEILEDIASLTLYAESGLPFPYSAAIRHMSEISDALLEKRTISSYGQIDNNTKRVFRAIGSFLEVCEGKISNSYYEEEHAISDIISCREKISLPTTSPTPLIAQEIGDRNHELSI